MAFNYPAALTLAPEASGHNLIQALNDNSELILQLSAGQTQDPFRVIDSSFSPLYRIGAGGLMTAQSAVVAGTSTLNGSLVAGATTLNSLGVTGTTNALALTAGPTSVGTLAASGLFVGPLSASGTITGTTALTRAASTGGLPPAILHVVPPADSAFPNVLYNGDVIFDFGTNTRTLAGGGAAIAGFDCLQINGPTLAASSGQILTAAATVHIVGAPASGGNVAFTNSCALQVQGAVCFGDNVATANHAANTLQAARNGTQYHQLVIKPKNNGNPPASTESSSLVVDAAANGTVTWSTGNLTTQRENTLTAPTYAALGGSIFTNAATLAIGGAPAPGANMTLTNSYALWIQAGGLRATGHLYFDGGTTTTAASGATMGTGAANPTVVAGSNDTRGEVDFTTGIGPAAGQLVKVTFATAYTSTPYVLVQALDNLGGNLAYTVGDRGTTGFSLYAQNAPAASTGYKFYYWVIQ